MALDLLESLTVAKVFLNSTDESQLWPYHDEIYVLILRKCNQTRKRGRREMHVLDILQSFRCSTISRGNINVFHYKAMSNLQA